MTRIVAGRDAASNRPDVADPAPNGKPTEPDRVIGARHGPESAEFRILGCPIVPAELGAATGSWAGSGASPNSDVVRPLLDPLAVPHPAQRDSSNGPVLAHM